MRDIALDVNGRREKRSVRDNELLLDLLRDDLQVKGVKAGCWRGECGLCSVVLNGSLAKSCLVLAVEANNGTVTTVEGISSGGELAPIQKAFIKHGASQCGFCTPAFVLTIHELMKKSPNPSTSELEEAVKGLICRCGTYNQMREAVASASKEYASAASASKNLV